MWVLWVYGIGGIAMLLLVMRRLDATAMDLLDIPWPPVWLLVALFGGAALSGLLVSGDPSAVPASLGLLMAIAGTFALICCPLLWYGDRKLSRRVDRQRARAKRGIAIPATVCSFERSGLLVNDVPQVRVTVSGRDDGREIRVTREKLVDPLHSVHLQEGAAACIVYDPVDDENHELYLGFEESPLSAWAEVLAEQQALLDRLNAEGLAAAATVRSCEVLPLRINNEGLLVKLQATIQPVGAESRLPEATFEAEFLAAVAEVRLSRYQPGSSIWVRYDPREPTLVAIDFARQGGTVSSSPS